MTKLTYEYCGSYEEPYSVTVDGKTRNDCFVALDREFLKMGHVALVDEDHLFFEAYESAMRGDMRFERRDFSTPESNYNLIWS